MTSVGCRSDRGRVREGNEDSFLVDEPLYVVADGMGGHVAGDVASATAVEVITSMAREHQPDAGGVLVTYIEEANSAIYQKAKEDSRLSGMGTTCTLLFLEGSTAHFAHVGDSRAYLFRGGELSQVTEDHTLVQRMVREGRIERQEAAHHPQRSIITRALGMDTSVEVDTLQLELLEGDRVLLCSDGLSSMLDDDLIARTLREVGDAQAAADSLVEQANEAGGEDNITVVLVDFGADGRPDGPPPPPTKGRVDTTPRPPEPQETGRTRSPWVRRIVVTALVLAVVLGGGYAAARYALSHSFFVGSTEDGSVAIYSGIPDEIAGISMRTEEEVTDISVDDLPESMQDNLEAGIKVDSIEEAERTVENLRDRAEDFGSDDTTRQRNRSGGDKG